MRSVPDMESPPSGLGPALGEPRPAERHVRRTAAGRPWDQISPWWLSDSEAATALAAAAAERRVMLDTAVAITIERSLTVDDLAAISQPGRVTIGALNELAAKACPTAPVSGAAALYLRQLSGTDDAHSITSRQVPIRLPGRIAIRLTGATDAEISALLNSNLDLALAWERAALIEGRTISEWAMWQALRLQTR